MNRKEIIQKSKSFNIGDIRFRTLCSLTSISQMNLGTSYKILDSINDVGKLCSDLLSLTSYVSLIQELAEKEESKESED